MSQGLWNTARREYEWNIIGRYNAVNCNVQYVFPREVNNPKCHVDPLFFNNDYKKKMIDTKNSIKKQFFDVILFYHLTIIYDIFYTRTWNKNKSRNDPDLSLLEYRDGKYPLFYYIQEIKNEKFESLLRCIRSLFTGDR